MSYFHKILVFSITLFIFGCSTTPSMSKKDNLLLGLKKYEANESEEAISLFKQSCDQHIGAACLLVSNILTDESNFKEAQEYLKKSCDEGSLEGCSILGKKYLDRHQLKEARVALEKSNHINLNSEAYMALLFLAEKKWSKAKDIAESLCDKQYPYGCLLSAYIAYAENDLITAKKFFALDTESFDSNAIFLGIIDLQLGRAESGEKIINEACRSHSPLACRIKELLAIQKSTPQFEKSYQLKCGQSDKDSCYNLGLHNFLKRKKDKSRIFFEKACKLGNGYGCLEKYNENTITLQPPLPINVVAEACEKGAGPACYLAYNDYKEIENLQNTNFLDKGCTLGNLFACFFLAEVEWKNKNVSNALKRYEESCKFGLQLGCFNFQFKDKNDETKEAVAQKFCNEKVDVACAELAQIYEKQDKKILAHIFYEKSCDLKNLNSCTNAIELKSEIDPAFKTFMPHYKLCNKGKGSSCMYAGIYLEEGKQVKDAVDLFERGCFINNTKSCEYLGWIYGEQKNITKSQYFYRHACDLGSSYACKNLDILN